MMDQVIIKSLFHAFDSSSIEAMERCSAIVTILLADHGNTSSY